MRLTGGVGAHVDDLALGAVNLVLVGSRQLGLDHDGVLRPGLQGADQVTRLLLLPVLGGARGRVHVRDHPAVGAASVLPVKLSHVGKGPGRNGRQREIKCLDLQLSLDGLGMLTINIFSINRR